MAQNSDAVLLQGAVEPHTPGARLRPTPERLKRPREK